MTESSCMEVYKKELQHYSIEQLRTIPGEGTWSLGQMYDHIILTALDYLDQVERCAAMAEGQRLGKTAAGEQVFKQGGFPPIRIRLPDGPANTPSNLESIEDLMRGFQRVEQRMKEWKGPSQFIPSKP